MYTVTIYFHDPLLIEIIRAACRDFARIYKVSIEVEMKDSTHPGQSYTVTGSDQQMSVDLDMYIDDAIEQDFWMADAKQA